MNSLGTFFKMIVFNLRLTSWSIWFLVPLVVFLQAGWTHLNDNWTLFGVTYTNFNGMVFLFYGAIASALLDNAKYGGGVFPYGEFLISRTVPRLTIYYSRLVLLFAFLLVAPLSENFAAPKSPNLKIEFCLSQNDENATDQQIKFYQVVFPKSSLVHDNDRYKSAFYYKTLLIPSGALLLIHWDLFVALAIALFIQWNMFGRKPVQNRTLGIFGKLILYYMGFSILYLMIRPQLAARHAPSLFESAFFYFAQHPIQSWLFLLGAFAFVQWIALRRAREIEII